MIKNFGTRIAAGLLPVLGLLLLTSCGRQAPSYEPANLTVNSSPAGAAIFINQETTGEITPHTFTGLVADRYEVSVTLTDHIAVDPVKSIDLHPLDKATLEFVLSRNALVITSTPPGARILLDGVDTEMVTPATIAGLEAGPVTLSLTHDSYYIFPASVDLTIVSDTEMIVPDDTFTLRAKKTVLLEGFSNVLCGGCPAMADLVHAITTDPQYSPDRLLYVKYSGTTPFPLDPFYRYQPAENAARISYYGGIPLFPSLFQNGTQFNGLGITPTQTDLDALQTSINNVLTEDPGFLIDVSADLSGTSIPVTVTLTALRNLDLTGHTLRVALVESEFEVPDPGYQGDTVFHNIFRDMVDSPPATGQLTSATPTVVNVQLDRGSLGAEKLYVIAFIQNDATLAVLQAGSTLVSAKSQVTTISGRIVR